MKTIKFGIVGEFQSGKSLLINCLLQRSVATVGKGIAATHAVINYLYAEKESINYIKDNNDVTTSDFKNLIDLDTDPTIKVINVYLNNPLLKQYSLTDMPGFGYNDEDNRAAVKAINNIDYAIVVASNYKSIGGSESPSYGFIRTLKQYRVPYYFILNCTLPDSEKWNPSDMYNENIAKVNRNIIEFYKPISFPFKNEFVPIVNLMWYWFATQAPEDELLQRRENKININIHELNNDNIKNSDIEEASNFNLIKQIFGMENKVYLELRRDFTEAIKQLRDEVCPIGTIQAFAFEHAPEGWLICDGAELSIETNNNLFKAIGLTYGGNKNEGIFCLPDLRGAFIRGWDQYKNIDPQRRFGSFQDHAIQGHSHSIGENTIQTTSNGYHEHKMYYNRCTSAGDWGSDVSIYEVCYSEPSRHEGKSTSYGGSHTHSISIDDSVINISNPKTSKYGKVNLDVETRPANIALLFCIKYE